MKLTLLLLIFFTSTLFAKNEWHMITFGRQGLGWSGTAERMQTRNQSEFKNITNFKSDLALNYAYRISDRFQLGLFYEGLHNEYNFRRRSGGTSPHTVETNTLGTFLIYNFHDDFYNSYYLGLAASSTTYEEEISLDFADAEGKAALELDDTLQTFELLFGKRFPITIIGFDKLSFSPQVRLFYQNHGKDFDDQYVSYGLGLKFQPIRFDLLF